MNPSFIAWVENPNLARSAARGDFLISFPNSASLLAPSAVLPPRATRVVPLCLIMLVNCCKLSPACAEDLIRVLMFPSKFAPTAAASTNELKVLSTAEATGPKTFLMTSPTPRGICPSAPTAPPTEPSMPLNASAALPTLWVNPIMMLAAPSTLDLKFCNSLRASK